ncbi:MAG: amino acid adenylation domain-containing protein [Cytophagales bacterium]|nr:amino acid adenylation domain-containing protein [Cytophagales bacterium]
MESDVNAREAVIASVNLVKERQYWLGKFAGHAEAVLFPTTRPGAGNAGERQRIPCTLSKEATEALLRTSNGAHANMHTILLAGLTLLLHKYSESTDITLGTPVYRQQAGGKFINTVLALRNEVAAGDSFKDLIMKVRGTLREAVAHQNFPYERLLFLLNPEQPQSLFDVALVLENIQEEGYLNKKDYHLLLSFKAEEGAVRGYVEFDANRYDKDTVAAIARCYDALLTQGLANFGLTLDAFAVLSDEDVAELVVRNNETEVRYACRTATEAFGEAAANHPDAVALEYAGRRTTYRQLDEMSNAVAHYLREHGVGTEDRIGIRMDRSEKLVILLLGILKAGAAYVPIEPATPAKRVAFILEDSGCKLLLTQEKFLAEPGAAGAVQAVDVDKAWLDISGCAKTPPAVRVRPADLAYVLYTSGSTGNPKGCQIEHRNLMNYVNWANQYYFGAGPAGNFGLYTSLSFDLTVTSIYCSLLRGKKLYVYNQEEEVIDVLKHSFGGNGGIDAIKLTPAHINLLEALNLPGTGIKKAIVGGEALLKRHVDTLRKISAAIEIYNEYGPTETTVGCIVKKIGDESDIRIGKPIANTQVYLLNDRQQPVPRGGKGEICVAGDGVGRGYLNREELTTQKFVANPFGPGKLYKTGDIGSWTAQGEMDYLGRADDQVKVRGYRIELGEIENKIILHEGVRDVVVDARKDASGETVLVAYVVAGPELVKADLMAGLQAHLPEYSIPGQIVRLDEIPLTANGKINRKALPEPDAAGTAGGDDYLAPRTETEKKLAVIWEKVLGKKDIGVRDNFFQLGGHSLKAIQLKSRIHEELAVNLNFRSIFKCPTIEKLAALILTTGQNQYQAIEPVGQQEYYDLSHAQKRLWVLNQLDKQQTAYNIPAAYELQGRLDYEAFARTFEALVNRHEILRTVFVVVDDEPKQKIRSAEAASFGLERRDLRADPDPDETLRALIREETRSVFDLETGPLVRAKLVTLSENRHAFLFTMHHIISDGWSMQVLIKDIISLYNAYSRHAAPTLPPLAIQYKDYAYWEKSNLTGSKVQEFKQFWATQFKETPFAAGMRTDFPKEARKNNKISSSSIETAFGRELKSKLAEVSQREDVGLFVVLVAALQVVLGHYSSQPSVDVLTPVAGRTHPELENQVGFYLNTLILRGKVDDEMPCRQLLRQVKESILNTLEYQNYPFDLLFEYLADAGKMNPAESVNTHVIFNSFGNLTTGVAALDGLSVTTLEAEGMEEGKYDLNFVFNEVENDVSLRATYNTALFRKSTVKNFVENLALVLHALATGSVSTVLEAKQLLAREERLRGHAHKEQLESSRLNRLLTKAGTADHLN